MTPTIVPATVGMIGPLAAHMRTADVAEVIASGSSPEASLTEGFWTTQEGSGAWAITAGDEPLAMFGSGPLGDTEAGCCWLLGTEALVTTHRLWFARNSPAIVATGHGPYDVIGNLVDARNTVHLRWLEWCGFRMGEPTPHGPYGLPFIPFIRDRRNV